MIDLSKKNILTDNLVPLKDTSFDKDNAVYMTNSSYQVVDFDKVKDKYFFKGSAISSHNMRSNDALVILNNSTKYQFLFIEFKNGNLDRFCEELKHEKIRSKINESLWILNDILDETLSFDRQNINYILVYNKIKNSNYSIKNTIAKRAGRTFLITGFNRYNVFFHDIKTVNEDDFNIIVTDLENSRYCF